MKQFIAGVAIVAFVLTTAVFAQRGEGGRGQGGGRMNAPQAQGAPAQQRGPGPGMGMGQMRGAQPGMGMRQGPGPQAQRGPGMGQMRGARPAPPQSYARGHAVPRPPMHPAYRPNYGPRYGYGAGPRGYYPYSGYPAPYYGYGYPAYGYPSIALGVTPYGWALGGVYGGVSVYYEKSTTVQESTGASVEVTATAYISFEVDAVDAEVYVDGAYEGVVEHFLEQPLEVLSGERHIELRLGGEKVGNFKVHPRGGQHVKIRAKLIR